MRVTYRHATDLQPKARRSTVSVCVIVRNPAQGLRPLLAVLRERALSYRMYGETRTRTGDTTIFSRVLMRLKHVHMQARTTRQE